MWTQSYFRPQTLIVSVLIILLTHLALFLPLPLIWRGAATLLLAGLLPGYLLTGWFSRRLVTPYSIGERLLYSMGVGYGILVIVMLLLSYLPGGIARWQTLAAFDLVLVLMLLLGYFDQTRSISLHSDSATTSEQQTDLAQIQDWVVNSFRSQRWVFSGLLLLVLVGGFFRFADLAYSEFQGDEARAVLRAAETIQGYRDSLLGHKKGPTEILIPTAIYTLTGQIDEATARLPFAIANFAGLFAIYLLGMRLFGPLAGWTAAMILAVDGYFIGFSHIVQYQSIVFLTVALTMLILQRLVSHPSDISKQLTLAAFILATGLLAHYEAALVVFPAIFLLACLGQKVGWGKLIASLIAPIGVGTLILSLFYIPFVLNPNFGITIAYITVNRIGVNRESGGFPYNNLVNVFERTALYSSTYYLLFLIGLTVLALALLFWRKMRRPWRTIVIALWISGVLLTFWQPDWGTLPNLPEGRNDYTWLFFGFAMVGAWVLPRVRWQERTVWIWFGAPMILSLFFIATPNTHVYGFFIGWSLLVGLTIESLWLWLREQLTLNRARAVALPIGAALILLFGTYEYWYFVHNQTEILRTWTSNRPPGYWTPYSMPTNMSIFGFPFRNGWKAVGALYAAGELDGAFTTNGRDAVADWYTRGEAYCPRDHRYYIYSQAVEPAETERLTNLRRELEAEYDLWGTVFVNGEERLRIYENDRVATQPNAASPLKINLDDYEAHFDETLAGPIFERGGPIGEALATATIGHPLDFWFGATPDDPNRAIRLRGFTLNSDNVLPGEEVELTLYWEAHQSTAIPYSVTTQLIEPNDFRKVGQNDGEPVCNMRPTNYWLPGELFADRYRIPVDADAPLGTYQVLIGLYDRESGEQLEAFAADGNPVGQSLGISQVDVVQP